MNLKHITQDKFGNLGVQVLLEKDELTSGACYKIIDPVVGSDDNDGKFFGSEWATLNAFIKWLSTYRLPYEYTYIQLYLARGETFVINEPIVIPNGVVVRIKSYSGSSGSNTMPSIKGSGTSMRSLITLQGSGLIVFDCKLDSVDYIVESTSVSSYATLGAIEIGQNVNYVFSGAFSELSIAPTANSASPKLTNSDINNTTCSINSFTIDNNLYTFKNSYVTMHHCNIYSNTALYNTTLNATNTTISGSSLRMLDASKGYISDSLCVDSSEPLKLTNNCELVMENVEAYGCGTFVQAENNSHVLGFNMNIHDCTTISVPTASGINPPTYDSTGSWVYLN